jgi:TatD DNase family protein
MAAEHLNGLRFVKPALGFHPLAAADNIDELSLFLSLLSNAKFVGEVGLDFSKQGLPTKPQQLVVFKAISDALARTPRFVTLHSRRAAKDVLEILEETGVTNVVFHWFSDTKATLQQAIDRGHYFSVNMEMLDSESGRRVLETAPRERILTETDGPYAKIGKRAASPSDIEIVTAGIAKIWKVDASAVESQVAANFDTICSTIRVAQK